VKTGEPSNHACKQFDLLLLCVELKHPGCLVDDNIRMAEIGNQLKGEFSF